MLFLRASAAALCLSSAVNAQAPSDELVFRAETERMQVEAQVLDRRGNPLEGLSVSDFELSENGEAREIESVDYVPAAERLPAISEGREIPPTRTATVAASGTDSEDGPVHPLWVYVAAEAGRAEFQQVHNGLEKFLREKVRENMAVSIGGLPFTKDRERLLTVLEQMRGSPMGRRPDRTGAWLPGSVDVTRWTQDDLETDREEAFDPQFDDGDSPRTAAIDEQIRNYNRFRLYRYLDLIDELGVYPGKKVVVLFTGGLRTDRENLALLGRISGEAARRRVAFYVVDSRGLAADQEVVLKLNRPGMANRLRGAGSGSRQQLTLERSQRRRELQQGMEELAKQTGGRFLANANDMSGIFDSVAADSSGYYLLTFRPLERGETEAVRTIRVRTPGVAGAKLRYAETYYEPEPFEKLSPAERDMDLHRVLLSNQSPDELRLRFDGGFFPDPDRPDRARFVYSLAAPTEHLDLAEDAEGRRRAELSLALRAYDPDGLEAQRFDLKSVLARSRPGDAFRYARYASYVSLPPGEFRFKVVVRDKASGRTGAIDRKIQAPDFSEGLTASTLLLTSVAAEAGEEDWRRMFEVQGRALFPRSPAEFRRGDLLYALYDLVGLEEAAPPPMKMALMRDRKPVETMAAASWMIPMPDQDAVRYFARIDTSDLEPGGYALFVLAPEGAAQEQPYLFRRFTLLDMADD